MFILAPERKLCGAANRICPSFPIISQQKCVCQGAVGLRGEHLYDATPPTCPVKSSFFESARQGSSRPDHTCQFPLTFPHSQSCTTHTTPFTARDWSALYHFAKCTLSVCRPGNQRQVICPQAAHVYFELLLSHPPTQKINWNSSNRCTHGSVREAIRPCFSGSVWRGRKWSFVHILKR